MPLCAGQATCTHWTWQGGACQLMAGATWTKLPGAGAISGVAGAACVAAPVLGNLPHVSTRVSTCPTVDSRQVYNNVFPLQVVSVAAVANPGSGCSVWLLSRGD